MYTFKEIDKALQEGVNQQDEQGNTLLHKLFFKASPDSYLNSGVFTKVKVLIDAGARVDILNEKGQTALALAKEKKQFEALEYFHEKNLISDLQENDFHKAVRAGDIDELTAQLENQKAQQLEWDSWWFDHDQRYSSFRSRRQPTGIDLGATDLLGRAPLHTAIEIGRLDMLQLLLAQIQSWRQCRLGHKSFLQCAVDHQQEEIVCFLFDNQHVPLILNERLLFKSCIATRSENLLLLLLERYRLLNDSKNKLKENEAIQLLIDSIPLGFSKVIAWLMPQLTTSPVLFHQPSVNTTAFLVALKYDTHLAKKMLEVSAINELIYKYPPNNTSALPSIKLAHIIAESGSVELFELIKPVLARTGDEIINFLENESATPTGRTALSCAVANRRLVIAQTLLALGARVVVVETNRNVTVRQDHTLIRAFKTGDMAICKLIYDAAKQQKITLNAGELLRINFILTAPDQYQADSRKVVKMLLILESQLTEEQAESIVSRLYAIKLKNDKNNPAKTHENIAAFGINRRLTFLAWQNLLEQIEQFAKDITALNLYDMSDWLIEQVFVHILDVNPHLSGRANLLADIITLLTLFSSEDKATLLNNLFVALQTCDNFDYIAPALRCLQQNKASLANPPKALFKLPQVMSNDELTTMRAAAFATEMQALPSLKHLTPEDINSLWSYLTKKDPYDLNEDRKNWLAYFNIFRDRKGLRICHHILKHGDDYPQFLCAALEVLERVGIARVNHQLENTELRLLISHFAKTEDLALKNQVLLSLWSLSQDPNYLMLREFYGQVLVDFPDDKTLVLTATRILGHFNFLIHPIDQTILDKLCEQSESADDDIRYQTALTLAKIPDNTALAVAKKLVASSLWDRHIKDEGLEAMNHHGSFYLFRKRPAEIHDNRSAMQRRIVHMQLLMDRQHTSSSEKSQERSIIREILSNNLDSLSAHDVNDLLAEFCNGMFRCSAIPIYLPPGSTLLRALSVRKGLATYHESVRDLIRKGCGTSSLTETEAFVDGGTWNKLGQVFGSPQVECFFYENNGYFKVSADGKLEETTLIAFSGDYYNDQLMRGEARMENEHTLNTVLYQGIPKQEIQAIFTPETLKEDIDLLAGSEPLAKTQVKLTSATFKDCSRHELKHLRRHLQTPIKGQPFVTRFHFFKVSGERVENKSASHDYYCGSPEKKHVHDQVKAVATVKLVKKDEIIEATLQMNGYSNR